MDKNNFFPDPISQTCIQYRIPEGVTKIADKAFYNFRHLESVVFPESLCSIGRYAFSGCTALNNVVIPINVSNNDSGAFQNC